MAKNWVAYMSKQETVATKEKFPRGRSTYDRGGEPPSRDDTYRSKRRIDHVEPPAVPLPEPTFAPMYSEVALDNHRRTAQLVRKLLRDINVDTKLDDRLDGISIVVVTDRWFSRIDDAWYDLPRMAFDISGLAEERFLARKLGQNPTIEELLPKYLIRVR